MSYESLSYESLSYESLSYESLSYESLSHESLSHESMRHESTRLSERVASSSPAALDLVRPRSVGDAVCPGHAGRELGEEPDAGTGRARCEVVALIIEVGGRLDVDVCPGGFTREALEE